MAFYTDKGSADGLDDKGCGVRHGQASIRLVHICEQTVIRISRRYRRDSRIIP